MSRLILHRIGLKAFGSVANKPLAARPFSPALFNHHSEGVKEQGMIMTGSISFLENTSNGERRNSKKI
jgi:hypothetical protein